MQIIRRHGLAGAAEATGVAIVIDTFRAFSTAAYAHANGVGTHILVSEVDEARALRSTYPDSLLCGEDFGTKPPDFELDNSPYEIMNTDLAGRTLIQRTSAGTRCVMAALEAGASRVLPAGFATASATARAASEAAEVSIVASGRHGTDPAIEDDLTADYIEAALTGNTLDVDVAALARASESADRFRTRASAKPADVDLCCDVDRFDFCLIATLDTRGFATVTRLDP